MAERLTVAALGDTEYDYDSEDSERSCVRLIIIEEDGSEVHVEANSTIAKAMYDAIGIFLREFPDGTRAH